MPEEKGDLLNTFYFNRSVVKDVQGHEQDKSNGTAWAAYESLISKYEKTFAPFGEHVILDFLKERKKKNQSSYVIDIASGGRAVRDQPFKGDQFLFNIFSDLKFLARSFPGT